MTTTPTQIKQLENESYCWILYRGKWQLSKFASNEYTGSSCFVLIEDKSGFPIVGSQDVNEIIKIEKPEL